MCEMSVSLPACLLHSFIHPSFWPKGQRAGSHWVAILSVRCVLLTHAYYRPTLVQCASLSLHRTGTLLYDSSHLGVKGIRKAHVSHQALLEEGEGADALSAIDNLVRHNEVHRLDVLLQGPDGAEGNDGAHADVSQGGDVGAGGHLVGGELVVGAMAGQEGDGHAVVLEDADGGRGVAPGRQGVDGCDGRVALDLGEAGAAYNGDVDRACYTGRGNWLAMRAFEGEVSGKGGKGACLYSRSYVSGSSEVMVKSEVLWKNKVGGTEG